MICRCFEWILSYAIPPPESSDQAPTGPSKWVHSVCCCLFLFFKLNGLSLFECAHYACCVLTPEDCTDGCLSSTFICSHCILVETDLFIALNTVSKWFSVNGHLGYTESNMRTRNGIDKTDTYSLLWTLFSVLYTIWGEVHSYICMRLISGHGCLPAASCPRSTQPRRWHSRERGD